MRGRRIRGKQMQNRRNGALFFSLLSGLMAFWAAKRRHDQQQRPRGFWRRLRNAAA